MDPKLQLMPSSNPSSKVSGKYDLLVAEQSPDSGFLPILNIKVGYHLITDARLDIAKFAGVSSTEYNKQVGKKDPLAGLLAVTKPPGAYPDR